jgi:transcription termination/antitermination protein NusA
MTQNSELKQAIELLCAERGVTMEDVVAAIENGVAKAYRKDFGENHKNYEAEYDLNTNTYKIFEIIEVTIDLDEEGNVKNPGKEISLMAARLSDPKAYDGQIIKTLVDDEDLLMSFGRVASGIAKQSFEQYIRSIRHAKALKEFKEKIGELINVEIDYFKKNGYYVKIGSTTSFLGMESLMPNDKFRPGQFIKVCVEDIVEDPKLGSKIILKRNSPTFVEALLKQEIPEVANGTIEILKVVRDAGLRTKVLVQKEDPEAAIDPVGTILGRKEVRILNVMRELNINLTERIDIIEFSDEQDDMIKDALEPARLTKIERVEESYTIEEGDQLKRIVVHCYCEKQDAALAVGRRGVNVRLASELLDINIKIQAPEATANVEYKRPEVRTIEQELPMSKVEESPIVVETEDAKVGNVDIEDLIEALPKKTRRKKVEEVVESTDKE